ncbi:hypothetical protein M407DRAFT_19533 [Tulasnella calospora MUT 4182]|uniref:Uncharacterized protein n=1 Tax=Tulasnella calospora MUT 4182 TaxID=1051891 RepID=A0A0C3QHN9_9AGAM|nr:hypothetical protein M407DRAFT_19533 [Tulasnella calospora MUT 4182]
MSDEEQCSSNSDVADRMESADRMVIEAPSTESASSTLFSREIDMDDAEDPKIPRRVDADPRHNQLTPSSNQLNPPPSLASDERSQLPMPDTNPDRDSAPSQSSPFVVAGRQTAPKTAPTSSVVETGRQVAASPSGRAPSTVSATDKVMSTLSTTSLPVVAGLSVVANRKTSPKPARPSSVVETGRQVAASPSGRAPSTLSATDKVLSTSPASLPVVAGRQPGPNATLPSSVVATGRQVAASPFGRAPSTVSATGELNGQPGSISIQVGTPSEAAMGGVESGRRAIKGSRRVARAIAKTKVTWQMVQQKARQTQAALEAAQLNAAASNPPSSLQSEELRLSQQWHAAQPPPPPEAMAYINTDQEEYDGDGEEYDGDPDDIDAQIAWALSH